MSREYRPRVMPPWCRIASLAFGLLVIVAQGWAAPPELETRTTAPVAHPAKPYVVEYRVRWEGAPGDVSVAPPILPAVEGLTLTPVRTTAAIEDGANLIIHEVAVVAELAGEYEIPPVEIGYLPHSAMAPPEGVVADPIAPEPTDYPTLASDSMTLVVRPNRTLLWVACISGAALFAGFAGVAYVRKKRASKAPRGRQRRSFHYEEMNAALHRARQHRLDGRFYDYLRDLADTVDTLPESADFSALSQRLRALADDAGFKNIRPSDDDLDGAMRDVERAVAAVRKQLHDQNHPPQSGVS